MVLQLQLLQEQHVSRYRVIVSTKSDGTGHCPGIGTQVFSVDSGSKTNLIFRINVLGQQGVSPNYSAGTNGPGGSNYRCSYNREVVLLHGGEGWVTDEYSYSNFRLSITKDLTIQYV